jgi:mannose-6-phosphate isomerase-like protein (cupin superfamily)
MLLRLTAVAAAMLATAAVAQPTPPPSLVFADAAEVQAAIAKAKAAQKSGQPSAPAQPLVSVPGYRTQLEYRTAPTPGSIHDREAELIYVVEGSGSMTMGGTLNDAKHTNPANQSGTGIIGGDTRPLAKGSFLFIPVGVAHYFATIGSAGLAIVTLKVPATPTP